MGYLQALWRKFSTGLLRRLDISNYHAIRSISDPSIETQPIGNELLSPRA